MNILPSLQALICTISSRFSPPHSHTNHNAEELRRRRRRRRNRNKGRVWYLLASNPNSVSFPSLQFDFIISNYVHMKRNDGCWYDFGQWKWSWNNFSALMLIRTWGRRRHEERRDTKRNVMLSLLACLGWRVFGVCLGKFWDRLGLRPKWDISIHSPEQPLSTPPASLHRFASGPNLPFFGLLVLLELVLILISFRLA